MKVVGLYPLAFVAMVLLLAVGSIGAVGDGGEESQTVEVYPRVDDGTAFLTEEDIAVALSSMERVERGTSYIHLVVVASDSHSVVMDSGCVGMFHAPGMTVDLEMGYCKVHDVGRIIPRGCDDARVSLEPVPSEHGRSFAFSVSVDGVDVRGIGDGVHLSIPTPYRMTVVMFDDGGERARVDSFEEDGVCTFVATGSGTYSLHEDPEVAIEESERLRSLVILVVSMVLVVMLIVLRESR